MDIGTFAILFNSATGLRTTWTPPVTLLLNGASKPLPPVRHQPQATVSSWILNLHLYYRVCVFLSLYEPTYCHLFQLWWWVCHLFQLWFNKYKKRNSPHNPTGALTIVVMSLCYQHVILFPLTTCVVLSPAVWSLPLIGITSGGYQYMDDLLQIEANIPQQPPMASSLYPTPVRNDILDQFLRHHPDPRFPGYTLHGFTNGFHISFDHHCLSLWSANRIQPSSLENP